jgi:hypothetical protein
VNVNFRKFTCLCTYSQQENEMRVPARFAPILFGGLLSVIMVAIVSAFVLATSQGIQPGFVAQWFKSSAKTWPVAFVAVTLIAPWVRQVVGRLTA